MALVAKRIVSPALVGRDDDLGCLLDAVTSRPAVVTIEGEAGIGKTRLVEELLRAIPDAAGRRLVGRCHGIREAFPLGPVIEAVGQLRPVLAGLPMSAVVGALRPVLPELAALLPPEPDRIDDRVAARHRVFRALRELLGGVGPLVLVLEDLHWADEQTIELLEYLVADPPPVLALILTFRDQEVAPAIRALAARLPATTTGTRLTLGPLSPAATGVLAAGILAVDTVSEEFASHLCERTAGLPFAMEEVLALLRARGSLVPKDGGWARRTLDELEVPTGIRDPVLERARGLSPAARAVVEAAAVLQLPVPERVLARVTDGGDGDVAPGLTEAVESGLLIDGGPAIGFRHLLAAQAVYEGLPGVRRRRLHARAAAGLAELVHPAPLGQVAHHRWHAGDLAAWATAAVAAADQAVALGHDKAAVRLLEEVLRHAPLDPERRGTVAIKLGWASVHAAPSRQVADLLAGALAADPPVPIRGQLRFLLGALLDHLGGDPVRLHALYRGAVEDLDGRPDLQAWAMVSLGVPMFPDVPLAEHLRWLHRTLEILPAVDDPAFQVFLLGKVAMVLMPIGDPQWRSITDRIHQLTGGSPGRLREVNAYYSVGAVACYGGRHELAGRMLRAGLAGAVACESEILALTLRSAEVLLDYCRGRWDGLAGRVGTLLDVPAAGTRARLDVEVAAGGLALAEGDLAAADGRLGDVIERAERLGAYDLLPLAAAARTRLAVARDDLDAAVAMVAWVRSVLEPRGVWAPLARALPWLVQALALAGQPEPAAALLARWTAELSQRDAPVAPAAVRHAHGFLAAATGRPELAARHFLAAAAGYQELSCPYERAQAHEQAAVMLVQAAGGPAGQAASGALRAAVAGYRAVGATRDLARATGLARLHGVPVPASYRLGRRGYGEQLSPRESDVAELAATGLTNKEIAERLFLSPSTVNKHVRSAMRKLSVRSRTGLAHQLAAVRPRPAAQ